eukprot:4960189-Prymnesium_polylepis.1
MHTSHTRAQARKCGRVWARVGACGRAAAGAGAWRAALAPAAAAAAFTHARAGVPPRAVIRSARR